MALFTRGIALWYKSTTEDAIKANIPGSTKSEAWGTMIDGLQEVGELQAGAAASAGYDKIEVTTLMDNKHQYIDGLLADEGEASSIDFTLLYDKDIYAGLLEAAESESGYDAAALGSFKGSKYFVTIPHTSGKFSTNTSENSVFAIQGLTSVKVNGASVNGAMTMTLTVTPVAPIEFTA